ncbi:N,N-dimethylformamidase beta subunit family domain-containing protein [Pyxidicoccus sp. 3LFB2]
MAQEPLVGISLPDVHAYAEKSIAAGETIHFRVSSSVPYTISIFRLGSNLDGPSADVQVFPPESFAPAQQPIRPGSYVNVDNALPATTALSAISLECWVRPWSLTKWQGLMTQHTFPDKCGYGLFIGEDGRINLYLGDGGWHDNARVLTSPSAIDLHQWTHIVGVWNGTTAELWLNGVKVVSGPLAGPVRPGAAPLRLGAYGDQGFTSKLLDGDLAMPVIYGRALAPSEIAARYQDRGLHAPALNGVLACWPLTEEKGTHLNDISGNARHGQIINGATWMIGGPSFDNSDVPRYGHDVTRYGYYEPANDPLRGHGLRFASDTLYDCGWQVTWSKQLPAGLKPGIYVGRIRRSTDNHIYDVTFVVKRAATAVKAPILVVCSTNTWLAYNATPFAPNYLGSDPRQFWGIEGQPDVEGQPAEFLEAPKYNFYRNHRSGQPTYRTGVNMPWPVAAPYVVFSDPPGAYYSHLTRAERFLHRWLEEQGYAFDVVTDFDLHQDPTVLDGYRVVVLNGHSEYWSASAYKTLERYLRLGGRNITLSGNTMCWRVSFDESLTSMECRKIRFKDYAVDFSGGRSISLGEAYHSDDGKRGSLMRECGYPAWSLLGLESVGFWHQAVLRSYVCETPGHKFFTSPNVTNLQGGMAFAPGSVGHEWDTRADLPLQGNLPYTQEGMTVLAYSEASYGPASADRPGGQKEYFDVAYWDYFMRALNPTGDVSKEVAVTRISEMIHWKRPMGGEVFFAGSIAAGMALKGSDARWGNVLRNVLSHYGVTPAPPV